MSVRIGCLVVAALVLVTVGIARADSASEWTYQQFVPTGMYGLDGQRGFRPPIAQRDLDAMADGLGLDASQREALVDLNRSLIDEFKGEWVAHRESWVDSELRAQAESGADNDWNAQMVAQFEQRATLQKRQDELVESLFTDLRLLLTPEQEERWASVERDRRRATTLGAYAIYDEEALDLASLSKALDMTPEQLAATAPVVERYTGEIDGVVAARDRAAGELGEKAAELFKEQQEYQSLWQTDQVKARELMEAQGSKQTALVPLCLSVRDSCEKVRDLNRAYIRELEPLIPESARKEWDKAIGAKRQSPYSMFMNVSRASASLRLIENLESQVSAWGSMMGDESGGLEVIQIMRSAEPLSAAQRQRIQDLRERHEGEVDAIKARHASTKPGPDEKATLNLLTPAGTVILRRVDAGAEHNPYGFMGGEAPNPEMIKELRTLDVETLKELRGILTINQRAAICMW